MQGILFGALGVVAFSFTLPMTALALASFPSLFLGAGRAVVAAAIAIVVLALTRTKLPATRQGCVSLWSLSAWLWVSLS